MPCCWRPVAHQQAVASGNRRAPSPDGRGIIPLNDYDGETPYGGEQRNATAYVVGWQTEHERIFTASDVKAAVAYRNETDRKLNLDGVPAGQLPADAGVALFER